PERFLNMLRVLKVTSPLSVGSFILAPFAGLSVAAFASHVSGRVPRIGRLAGLGAAAFGPPLTTYTAALLCNTAVPAWHEGHQEMPFLFAGSGATAAGGLAMVLTPAAENGPARRMAIAGAGLELAAAQRLKHRLGMVAEPYEIGRPGLLMRTARAMTAASAVVSLVAGRNRAVSVVAGTSYVAASLITRFGVFEAGLTSARDPKYTVIPQRERLERRRAEREHEDARPAR
ncbi:MAG: NrfD/PsrC family molybdoenzyme membrane anchor subunit, partial [Nocardioidaceae bacterium]